MKEHGPLTTPYSDIVVPKPSAGSADGNTWGTPLSGEGPAKVEGKLSEVQFSDIGPKPGAKQSGGMIQGGGSH